MELPYRGLSRPPPTPRATSGPGEHSPAMYRCLHSPHVQLVVPSFPPRGPRALLCPETPPAMEAREGHHMRRDGLGPKQGCLIQKERRNTPEMSRTSRSSWLKRVSFWPHNRVHPITDSTEELPENQPEGLPISTLEEEALPNSIACEQASEHAPQEHLVLELPQAGAEDPPLPPLEAAGEASERGFTEDLPVNPTCDRTEETPYVSKVALSECENDCFLENISNSDAEDNSASAYDEYMADDEDSETVSKNTEVAYDCCLETPDEYMADDEDSETMSDNSLISSLENGKNVLSDDKKDQEEV